MKHLLRPQFRSFLRNLPCSCRRFCVDIPKIVPSPEPTKDTLRSRIERVQDSTVSITPLLHEWRELGHQTRIAELRSIISSLHRFDRFSHALQISEWMSEQKGYNLSSVDFETRLLLVAKVHGLEEGSKFLDTIPLPKRDFYVHDAFLNCCKTQGSISVAETTFQKMRDLGLAVNDAKPFNTMLYLYHEAEEHDKMVKLLREMVEKNMEPAGVPFGKLMTCFATANYMDVEGMEEFLSKWGDKVPPWATYLFPGLVYLQVGSNEKGKALLRVAEQLIADENKESIYGNLMSMYCELGDTEDIYRLWNLGKDVLSLDSYGIPDIIKAFAKKGDLDGAHEILEECDSGDCIHLTLEDFGLRKKCMKEEAEKMVDMLGKKESNWESLASKIIWVEDEEDREEERRKKVTEAMEGRLSDRWNPKSSMTLSAYTCLQYVEGRRDIESAADILRQLNKRDQVSHVMDKGRLSLKVVEAMRGGGYAGGED